MEALSLDTISQIVGGKLLGDDAHVQSIVNDSRAITKGGLYVAIKGEKYDGHQFVADAHAAGAAAALVEQQQTVPIPQVLVENTRQALGLLAHWYCCKFQQLEVVAVTGSNGKTTTKEMLGEIYSGFYPTLITKGNYNNDLGVPLTVLRHQAGQRHGIFELGANHVGEIDYLSSLVEPNIAVITNIGPAHLEGFGSIDGVLKGKTEIFKHLKPSGVALFNHDTYGIEHVKGASLSNLLTFGEHPDAHYRIKNLRLHAACPHFEIAHSDQQYTVRLQVPGKHNAWNATAAFAVAHCAGLDSLQVIRALEAYGGAAGRLQYYDGITSQTTIIDDTYNANTASFQVAIDTLAGCQGRKILVMGEMSELGGEQEHLHAFVGQYAKQKNIDCLFAVGELTRFAVTAFGQGAKQYPSQEQLIEELKREMIEYDTLLIKGSRAAKMEVVVNALTDRAMTADRVVNDKTGGRPC